MDTATYKEVIKTKVGEPFEIKLEGNTQAGYEWYLSHMEIGIMLLSAKHKQKKKKAYLPDINEEPGKATFCFVSFRECKGQLKFIYKKPWENFDYKEIEYDVSISNSHANRTRGIF